MKILSFIVVFLLSYSGIAQSFRVHEEQFDFMNAQNANALTLDIPYANADFVGEKVKKLFKGWGKHKESKGEHSALMAELKAFGKMPFTGYARLITGSDEVVKVYVGIDLGGAFLSRRNHSEKFEIMENILIEFAKDVVKDWISQELRKEEKALSQLEKEQKDLEKRKEHLEKEIKDFEKKIEDNKNEIKENLEMQSKKKEELTRQKKQVQIVSQKLKELR